MASRWQQLGAFVGESSKLTDARLDAFVAAGGRWIVVLLAQLGYPDDHDQSCVRNLGDIENTKRRCAERGIACGAWLNGWNGGELGWSPAQEAQKVADIVKPHNLGPVVLDLESAYKNQTCPLPTLLREVRLRITTRELAVSTNEPNDSMPWNGQGCYGDYRASARRLGVKVLPQHYNAPAYGHGTWMRADQTFEWLQAHGMQDNFLDPTYANKRAVPLSYVHPTHEVTGLEGADLAGELAELETAKQFGFTYGFSLYLLEDAPDSDLTLCASKRGHLFLV